jgi:hypothetical protein
LKEKEFALKYRKKYELEKKTLVKQLKGEYDTKYETMKKDLGAKIAEVQRLRSLENVKLKKF